MYSLHSERVAVGARQLWRQRVIVARQPDRSKMAELTGTGEQTSFTLAVFGKFSLLAAHPPPHPSHPHPPNTPYDDYLPHWNHYTLRRLTKKHQRERERAQKGKEKKEVARSKVENLSLFCLCVETGNFRRDSHQAILAITCSSTKK